MGIKIIGTGRALPERIVSNHELAMFLDTSDEWIVSKTGIKNRRVSLNEGLTDLAEKAGRLALQKSGLTVAEIDLILCSTICGDYVVPSLSCCVAERLSASCPAFDLNAACSGFVYALDIAESYINSGKAGNILIISADTMSKHVDWTDRQTCVLFGDGAGACVVTGGNALKYIRLTTRANTEHLFLKTGNGNLPFAPKNEDRSFLHMQGQEVFKFAVQSIEKETALAMDTFGIAPGDIDYFILHQANYRIIETAGARMKQPTEKFPVNIDKYGNVSSGSIPILLDEMLEAKKIAGGCMIIMIAFGAGMTIGTCIMQWE